MNSQETLLKNENSLSLSIKALKHRNIPSAIFHLSFTTCDLKDLYYGILYYEDCDYHQALHYLKNGDTNTAAFYRALCYKQLKDYTNARSCLTNIVTNTTKQDVKSGNYFDNYYLTSNEYVFELIGECSTMLGERTQAIGAYKEAWKINPLITTFDNLCVENEMNDAFLERAFCTSDVKNLFGINFNDKKISISNEAKESMKRWKDKENINRLDKSFPEYTYFKDRLEFKQSFSHLLLTKYKLAHSPANAHFLSDSCRLFFESGDHSSSLTIFDYLLKIYPFYFSYANMYSTLLWHKKDLEKLAYLCRTLIEYMPNAHVTWIALGNYFSLNYDHNRAIVCFKRSLAVNKSAYAHSLLGHEYVIKQEYTKAMKSFVCSIKMQRNNYNAKFALGIVYAQLEQYENAEFNFLKGVDMNKRNVKLRFMLMQFYNKRKQPEKNIKHFLDVFSERINSDEQGVKGDCNKLDITGIVGKLGAISLSENDEMVALEIIDYLVGIGKNDLASGILEIIRYRGSAYFNKKELVHGKNEKTL